MSYDNTMDGDNGVRIGNVALGGRLVWVIGVRTEGPARSAARGGDGNLKLRGLTLDACGVSPRGQQTFTITEPQINPDYTRFLWGCELDSSVACGFLYELCHPELLSVEEFYEINCCCQM